MEKAMQQALKRLTGRGSRSTVFAGNARLGEPKVIVVVLGWWQSRPKSVEKYSKVYAAYPGVAAVVQHTLTTPELAIPLLRDAAGRRVIKTLKQERERIREETNSQPKLVFHAMSNNGTFLFLSLVKQLPADMLTASVGAVFDSCPGNLDARSGLGAAIAAAPNPGAATAAIGASMIFALLAAYQRLGGLAPFARAIVAPIAASLAIEWAMNYRYRSRFVASCLRCPELYLYSKEDALVHYSVVQQVSERRRQCGINVEEKQFKGSAHVAHLQVFPEEYKKTIAAFLDRIIK